MIEKIKKWLNIDSVNYKELISQGARIIDVRTSQEFKLAHIPGSINIPIDQLTVQKLSDKKLPIILCCSTGTRSATAKNLLKSSGVKNVYDAGNWRTLLQILTE